MASRRAPASALLLAALLVAPPAAAKIHRLHVTKDHRFAFSIESFGFLEGGSVSIRIHDVDAQPAGAQHMMGFVLYPASTESRIAAQVSTLVAGRLCALDADNEGLIKINVSDRAHWAREAPVETTLTRPGLYDLLFTHCEPAGGAVSFTADVVFANPGGHFLPAGELPLPALYGGMAAAFAGALALWLRFTRAHAAHAHSLHHLMSALGGLKALSLACEALMYHYIDTTGHSTGWNVAYYIVTAARGLLTVAVIALLGAGWSLVRPFLNTREKHVLMVALPLQVLTNIATIVVDEMAPGSTAYGMWFIVLKLADFASIVCVLVPVWMSIRSLQTTAASEGVGAAAELGAEGGVPPGESGGEGDKARETLKRLRHFRTFYMVTIGYIYVSRVLSFILYESTPYHRTWLAPAFEELATLLFFVYTGWRFRPAPENSEYYSVPSEDDGRPAGERVGDEDDVAISLSSSHQRASGGGAITQTVSKTARGGDDGGGGYTSGAGAASGLRSLGATAAAASVAIAGDSDDELDDSAAAAAGGKRGGAGRPSSAAPARGDDDEDGELDALVARVTAPGADKGAPRR